MIKPIVSIILVIGIHSWGAKDPYFEGQESAGSMFRLLWVGPLCGAEYNLEKVDHLGLNWQREHGSGDILVSWGLLEDRSHLASLRHESAGSAMGFR